MTKGTRLLTILVLCTIISLTWIPPALAELEWESDGWLTTSLATDRLENGDEFGCYQMLHLSWKLDPGAMAIECRDYIENNINASKWGHNVMSTYTPSSLSMTQHEIIAKQGLVVHGDETGLEESAWHDSQDVPIDIWDWYNLGRRGGSLEQIVGSVDTVKNAVEEGGLVNLYWIGRVDDASIRYDRDIANYLNDDADAWLTTWGESWSYWTVDRCYEFVDELIQQENETILYFESLQTESCNSVAPEAWNVPITWKIDTDGIDISEIRIINTGLEDTNLSNIAGSKNSVEGWFQVSGEYLHLSVLNGHRVEIHFSEQTNEYDIIGRSQFWNNHSTAVTIASHHTSDLFLWSKGFTDYSSIKFTWLLEPRLSDGYTAWLPIAVIAITSSTILGMLYLLKREGIGPLAGKKS
ncbi:MAG: hypothetical protein NZ736_01835 [Candidatus Poseidoniaceae archaeon]|nr:hypothetical protein [Candidatus Poseidoniaceae archaeon]